MPYSIREAFKNIGVNPVKKVNDEIYISELLKSMRLYLAISRFDKAEEIREKILVVCGENSMEIPQECRVIK